MWVRHEGNFLKNFFAAKVSSNKNYTLGCCSMKHHLHNFLEIFTKAVHTWFFKDQFCIFLRKLDEKISSKMKIKSTYRTRTVFALSTCTIRKVPVQWRALVFFQPEFS